MEVVGGVVEAVMMPRRRERRVGSSASDVFVMVMCGTVMIVALSLY